MEIKRVDIPLNTNYIQNTPNPSAKVASNKAKVDITPAFNIDLQRKREEIIRELERIFRNLDKYTEKINEILNPLNKELKVEIDEELNIPIFKIINKQTNEVIRQIPLEEILRIAKNMEKLLESQKEGEKYLKGLLLKAEV